MAMKHDKKNMPMSLNVMSCLHGWVDGDRMPSSRLVRPVVRPSPIKVEALRLNMLLFLAIGFAACIAGVSPVGRSEYFVNLRVN